MCANPILPLPPPSPRKPFNSPKEDFPGWLLELMFSIEESTKHVLFVEYEHAKA